MANGVTTRGNTGGALDVGHAIGRLANLGSPYVDRPSLGLVRNSCPVRALISRGLGHLLVRRHATQGARM